MLNSIIDGAIYPEVTDAEALSEGSSENARDVLTEVLKQGAQRMLAVAIQAEADEWIEDRKQFTDENGCQQVVRNGYLPERKITTGVGEIKVRQKKEKKS